VAKCASQRSIVVILIRYLKDVKDVESWVAPTDRASHQAIKSHSGHEEKFWNVDVMN
jgi:hypothetical protein